ncbi:MAG: GNAT family N-acetyltransferase [Myxococcaceae bacterium]|nr:GNAT family N-acetyltransferase [Myxococcaceae bacterium]
MPTHLFSAAELLPPPMRDALTGLERRHALRAPTGLSFVFADQLALLNPAAWDELTAHKTFLLSRRYLDALERAKVPHLSHRYVLAFDGSRPVLAMALQILDVGVDRLRPGTTRGFIEGLDTAQLEERVRQRVLVCGNLLSGGLDGVAFAEGLEPTLGWRAVAEALYRVRRAEKLNGHTNLVVVKDLTGGQVDASRALEGMSYRAMAGGPTMVLGLDPTWRTHDDYLAGMTSKHRSDVKRRIVGPLTEAGVRVTRLTVEQVRHFKHRMQALHLEVQDHASVRPITVGPDYWPAMAWLDDVCVVHGVLRGDELLGFLLVQVMGDEVHAAQIGFSREAAKELPLYLRLLHTAVEEGIARRARRVVLGRTALEPKARMGAKPVDTFLWVRHRVPVVNSLARGLVDLVRHEPAPHIDPFKRIASPASDVTAPAASRPS